MLEAKEVPPSSGSMKGYLFDRDGLPWTSGIRWGMLLFWVAAVLILLAPLVGGYLGLWLISKGRSALSLILYLVLAVLFATSFFVPFPTHTETALVMSLLVLWLVSAFTLRREVIRYYSDLEGIPFVLNRALTALFGPWYIGGNLRATFPLNGVGRVGSGVLKLVD